MSKLNDLILELCPDGVILVKVADIAEVGTGNSNTEDAIENGIFPFYVRSKDIKHSDKFTYDEESIIIPGEGGIGEIFHYVNGKYQLHQRAYRIHPIDSRVNTKFLFYYFTSNFKRYILGKAVTATVSSIRKPMIETFKIPIPPLPVQKEIVRILDKFTMLEADLKAELDLRKKQYEYYRDKLLTFKELIQ